MNSVPHFKTNEFLMLLYLYLMFPFMVMGGELLSMFGTWSVCIIIFLTGVQILLLFCSINRRLTITKDALSLIIRLILIIFLLLSAVRFTQLFADLFVLAIRSDSSKYFVSAVMLGISAYAAYKGIRGLTATSVIFIMISVITFVLFIINTFQQVDFTRLKGIDFVDKDLPLTVALYISINFVFPVLFVDNSSSPIRNKKKGLILAPIALLLTQLVFLLVMFLFIGKYAYTQAYPIYTLFRSSQLNILESVSGLWIFIISIFALCAITIPLNACIHLCGKTPHDDKQNGRLAIVVFVIAYVLYVAAEYKLIDFKSRFTIYLMAILSILSVILCFIASKPKTLCRSKSQ